jgi:hypothetical protein
LINLAGVGLLELLPALYGTLWVPEAVSREYTAGIRAGDTSLEEFAWVKLASPVVVQTKLPPGLGAGEVEAISLAVAVNARAILLDERLARGVAREKGLLVVGTLAVLIAAKQNELLVAVKPVIDAMIQQGRHISERLYQQIIVTAGEQE